MGMEMEAKNAPITGAIVFSSWTHKYCDLSLLLYSRNGYMTGIWKSRNEMKLKTGNLETGSRNGHPPS